MSLLVVGSVALDSVETPFGSVTDALGGSALFFSRAACLLHPVQVVGVVGDDYPMEALDSLTDRGIDISGVERKAGESFRWKGRYSHDLLDRETLETRLGVFADFEPTIPQEFQSAEYVFLGNINPELQLSVLDQIRRPKLVVCDTMNFWIEGNRDTLLDLLQKTDVLMVNDTEAILLSGEWNVYKAAKWILERGPSTVVIKQGSHGAFLLDRDQIFYVPAFPLEDVQDPTGAGDSFAGGFMAQLARSGDLSHEGFRKAMVYGATMGSFLVERFSTNRFDEIGIEDIDRRVSKFAELVRFDVGNG